MQGQLQEGQIVKNLSGNEYDFSCVNVCAPNHLVMSPLWPHTPGARAAPVVVF